MIIAAKLVIIAIIGYLLGAIPFGLIICRWMANIDIRRHGSGNIGTTNVFRVVGGKLGLVTMFLDLAKAAIAVLIAMFIIGDDALMIFGSDVHLQVAQALAALMAIVGHDWSIYTKFKGGKGVAAFMGGLFVINPLIALIGGVISLIIALLTRYASLGSILGSLTILLAFIIMAVIYQLTPDHSTTCLVYVGYALAASGLIIYQHRTNIQRLQAGVESKLWDKSGRIQL